MCGISGILGPVPDRHARDAVVREMMHRLAHRGPDGEGLRSGELFCLGHRRLAIIDPTHGAQPMRSADGRYTLILNGEIYNYVELRQQLTQRGVSFRTFSDTEVLLSLLIQEGTNALAQLRGMFALALVDEGSGEWLLARDPFGIKPLYYTTVGETLVFSSEIKALFAHPAIRAGRDPESFQQYLTFQWCLGERTLFSGIRKLPPGCLLQGTRNRVGPVVRYWDLDFRIDEDNREEYFIEQLRSLLEESVALQLRSDVPVGTYLSGGLDSSVVTMLAAPWVPALQAFCGVFEEGEAYDETQYARVVAEASGCQLHVLSVTAPQFVEDLPRLIEAMDEPAAGPGLLPQYRVSRLAREHVKVVLGGQGGDEVFGGYARYLVGYLEQALKGAIFETQEEGRYVLSLASIIPNLPLLRRYRPLMQDFWREGLFEDMDARYFRLIDRSGDLQGVLSTELQEELDHEALFEGFRQVFHHPDTKSYINKMTHFDMRTALPALLHVEDRVSMAVSLESRVPLLDTRIVDLVTSMPPALKFEGGRTKHVLKRAVSTLVPPAILERKDKMGFPVPLREWLARGPVRTFARDTLLGQTSRERGLFDPAALERLLDDPSGPERPLWGALCLELWHRRFIDGGP
jgi:asparagine synthase (glutamine-hydrolysing)